MNVIDIIIIVILLFAAVRGFMTGLFAAIASLVAIIAGVFCAIHYSYYIEYALNDSVLEWSHQTNKIVAFAVTFLAVVLAVIFVGKLLTKLADITALGLLNKILGAIFGALKWSFILSVIFLLFDKFNKTIPFVEEEMLEESVMFYPIKSIIPTLIPSIMDEDNPSLKFIKGK
ncbi:CvpA family protein [Polaribacter sp. MED152]|uniref:CvpA family protein n=1 Tax=Polaribacter sp. MED152 TaxID=313598 RepID=UPI000068CC27|nr:CvpA family protein [Polaribacter sp. MED152]EAQ42856.1 colicin V production protein [Polaribacter sp. MED152]